MMKLNQSDCMNTIGLFSPKAREAAIMKRPSVL